MNKYIENLQKTQEENYISKTEFTILKFLWEKFGIEFPPYRFLPLIYSFIIVFSTLLISVSIIVLFVLSLYSFFNSTEDAITIYGLIEAKYWNVIVFGTIIWLLGLAFSRDNFNWNADKNKCWRSNLKYNIDKKTSQVFIIFSILVFILATSIFTYHFIIFLINSLSVIIVIESVKKILVYKSVTYWKKILLIDIQCDTKEELVLDDISIGKINKVKLYSLYTTYTYKNKGKVYCSSQIYIDEPRDGSLFENKNKYSILQWLNENNNLEYAYVNPKNSSQAVLFKEVLLSSYVGKIFIIIGAMIVMQVINNYIDWVYYFE